MFAAATWRPDEFLTVARGLGLGIRRHSVHVQRALGRVTGEWPGLEEKAGFEKLMTRTSAGHGTLSKRLVPSLTALNVPGSRTTDHATAAPEGRTDAGLGALERGRLRVGPFVGARWSVAFTVLRTGL